MTTLVTVVVGIAVILLLNYAADRLTRDAGDEPTERRPGAPQIGSAGTGVEQTVSGGPDGFAALLPRSHPASAGTVDPRPAVPAGLLFPAGVVLIPASREAHSPDALLPSTTLAGLQPPTRRRVVFGA